MARHTLFKVHFIETQDNVPSNLPHLRAGLVNRTRPYIAASVLVENDGHPVFILDIFGKNDDYFFKQSVLFWNSFIVVGVGEQITFVHSVNYESTTTDLEGYFGYLYPADNLLLVASQSYLHCFDDTGKLRWKSDDLGIDGVIVEQIDEQIVSGLGEWDPPDGWRPFKLSLATGQSIL